MGNIFFQNAKFEKFAEIDNNASATDNGAIIEIWNFNADADQKWNITYLYNGYYKITSTASGMALTAPTSTNASITQTVYTGLDEQLWVIKKNTDGTYKLSPKSNQSQYMAAGAGLITARGRNVEMRTEQSDNRDDWNLFLVSEYVSLRLNTRIFYDPDSALDEYSLSAIQTVYEDATEGFVKGFNIEFITPTVSPSNELTVPEECYSVDDVNLLCYELCGALDTCNTTHHKSSWRMLEILTSRTYYTCRIVGYDLCRYRNGHAGVRGSGNYNGKNSIVSTTATKSRKQFVLTLQHELTHNLGGSVDHECTEGQDCVLQGQLDVWCDACSEEIRKNH